MTTYEVTIRATITKTLKVEASTEAEAVATAHDQFTVQCSGADEDYTQETKSVELLT